MDTKQLQDLLHDVDEHTHKELMLIGQLQEIRTEKRIIYEEITKTLLDEGWLGLLQPDMPKIRRMLHRNRKETKR